MYLQEVTVALGELLFLLSNDPILLMNVIFRSCFIPFVVQFIACAVFQKWYVRILPVAIMFLVLLTNFCLIILEARGNHDFSTYYLSEGFGLTDQWVIFLLGFFMLPIQLCGWWLGHALGKLLRAKKNKKTSA